MARINPVDPATATGKTKELLDGIQKSWGVTPNLVKTMAVSEPVLEGFVGLNGALSKGQLPPRVRELLSIAVSQQNGCEYCLSAHTTVGRMLKASEDDLDAARDARSSDPKVQAALQFAVRVNETKGFVSDDELAAVRSAGYSDAEVLEIIGHVVAKIMTNYINHVSGTELDWPLVPVNRS